VKEVVALRRLLLVVLLAGCVLPASASEPSPAPFQKVFVPDTVRVQFFAWATPEQVEAVLAEHRLRPVGGPAGGLVVARTAGGDPWLVAAQLNRSPFVDWAVPHYVLRPARPGPVVRVRPLPPGRP